jgi:hypothetical protein
MNDAADSLLLDIWKIIITDREFVDEESALNRTLCRLLKSNADIKFNSFNSGI